MGLNIAAMGSRDDPPLSARLHNAMSPRTARGLNTARLGNHTQRGNLSHRGPKTPLRSPLALSERYSAGLASPSSSSLQKRLSSNALKSLRKEDSTGTETEPSPSATVLSVDIPKLSLGAIETKGKAQAETRKKKRISTDNVFCNVEAAKKKLEADGIDIDALKAAFSKTDVNDSGLDINEFRNLWKMVFPQRPLDESAWRYIDRIFIEIDNDDSDEISWEEILSYLDKSRTLVEREKPPTQWKEIMFRFVGYTEDAYDDSDSLQAIMVALYKFVSQMVVVLSIVVLMIESLPSMQKEDPNESPGSTTTFVIETCCVAVFTVEFFMWIISYPTSEQWIDSEGKAHVLDKDEEVWPRPDTMETIKWRLFFKEQNTYIDFLSIVPYYILLIVDGQNNISALASVRLLRLLRLLRITRILKLGRSGSYGRAPELGAALQKSITSLLFLVMLIVIATTMASSWMFYAELEQASFNPVLEKWVRNNDSDYVDAGEVLQMQSIPEALWWGIVTLTTVGYGDLYPITIGGKIIASVTMLGGLIVVGYPITILTGTFQIMEYERFMKEEQLDRCREFYQGIKTWVNSQDGIDVKLESENGATMKGNTSKRSSLLPQPTAMAANQDIVDLFNGLENRIAERLGRIKRKLNKLECDSDVSESEIDTDSSSSCSSSTSSATSLTPAAAANEPYARNLAVPVLHIN
eukprot:TRINITY_DN4716_c3_g2_i1.p1 TRINITY_DN4716_c3_g2~~TRINITY_DN4716_c3_g2_i1.p1  ORF type:complete len:713 (+),score=105.87 TRINITY_DN4716_c3_g2_i1:60-2141(+)